MWSKGEWGQAGELTRTRDPTSVSLPPVLISRWLAEVLGTFCHGAIQACLGNWRNWGAPVGTVETTGLAAAPHLQGEPGNHWQYA